MTRIPATRDVSLPGGRRPTPSDGRAWSRASAGDARPARGTSTSAARGAFSPADRREAGRALTSGRRPAAHGKEGR